MRPSRVIVLVLSIVFSMYVATIVVSKHKQNTKVKMSPLEQISEQIQCPPAPYITRLKGDTCTANGRRTFLWKDANWTDLLKTPYIEFSERAKDAHKDSDERLGKPPWEYDVFYMMNEAYGMHLKQYNYKVEKPFMWILKNVYAELVNDLTNIFDTEGYHYRQDLGCEQKPLLKSPMSPTLLPPDWRVPEKAILTVQVYSQAYYHHVLEGTLLRMFLVEALLDELKLPQSYFDSILLAGPISSYVTESLSLFGWTNQEQITINHDDDGRSVFSKEAWVPTGNGCCMPSCYQIRIAHHYINKRLKLWGRLDRKKEVIIIIRRDDSHKRRIINWKALYDATKKKFPWVQVVVFEEPFSFVDTVRLFAKAKLVIAPHGAGNANMLFARPDYARLIEIQTPWYNGYSLCYLRTSICFGHDYTSLRYDTFEVDVDDVLEHAERAWYRKSIYEKNQDL